MRSLLVAVILLAVCAQFVRAQDAPDACEAKAEKYKHELKDVEKRLHSIQHDLKQKEKELLDHQSKLKTAEQQLQSKLKEIETAQQELQASRDKLKSHKSDLKTATSELQAARHASDSCKSTLVKVEGELEQLQQRYSEAVKNTGDAWLPPWLIRTADKAAAWSKSTMAQLQSSDMTAQLNKAVAPYWKAAAPYWKAVAPHVQTAQDKLAGVHKVVRPHLNTIVDHVKKLDTQASIRQAGSQFKRIERELNHVFMSSLQSHPATAKYADPVLVQILTYMVIGAPVLLILPAISLLSTAGRQPPAAAAPGRRGKQAARGGGRTSGGNGRGGRGNAGGTGPASSTAAAAGMTTPNVSNRGRGATNRPTATPGGKRVQDGQDVLFTP
eukprot:jgi/Chrzof1/5271/Cz15g20070.t1